MNLQKTEEALKNALELNQKLTLELEALRRDVEEAKARRDPLGAHIFRARARYRSVSASDNKSGRRTRQEVTKSFFEAKTLGYRGGGDDWWELMRAWARQM